MMSRENLDLSDRDVRDDEVSIPDRNVRDDVPDDVPVEIVSDEAPDAKPMSQWEKSLEGDVPVGIVADESPGPRPTSDYDSWHGDIFDSEPESEGPNSEPSPAPHASPAPSKVADTSAGPLGMGMPSGIPVPVIAEESYVTPRDPETCVSISESATDDWCIDACEAGMCSAQMCKCDEDANLVLARRNTGSLMEGQSLPKHEEQSQDMRSHSKHTNMHSGSYESLTRRRAILNAPTSKSPNQHQTIREAAQITGPDQTAAIDTPHEDILD
jgi:hypothetical protein